MGCDESALVCAVRDLNETLQAGPSPWVTQLVVPLAVALLTLLVSGLVGTATLGVSLLTVSLASRSNALAERSTRTAERATALAEQVRGDALERQRREDRALVVDELAGFVEDSFDDVVRARFMEPNTRSVRAFNGASYKTSIAKHSDAPRFLEALKRRLQEVSEEVQAGAGEQWAANVSAVCVAAARRWLVDPLDALELLARSRTIKPADFED